MKKDKRKNKIPIRSSAAEYLTFIASTGDEQAKLHAETEYEKYRIIQDKLYESDFDRFLLLENEFDYSDFPTENKNLD